jgi:predicted Holliday junction resolvase-like endonuclease
MLRSQGIFCHSVPNDFIRDARTMGTAITMGLFPGVADLIVWWPTGIGYLEVKVPGGKLSPRQENFRKRCQNNDIRYDVVYSMDELDSLMQELGNDKK